MGFIWVYGYGLPDAEEARADQSLSATPVTVYVIPSVEVQIFAPLTAADMTFPAAFEVTADQARADVVLASAQVQV
jgi:hypothetical protein